MDIFTRLEFHFPRAPRVHTSLFVRRSDHLFSVAEWPHGSPVLLRLPGSWPLRRMAGTGSAVRLSHGTISPPPRLSRPAGPFRTGGGPADRREAPPVGMETTPPAMHAGKISASQGHLFNGRRAPRGRGAAQKLVDSQRGIANYRRPLLY